MAALSCAYALPEGGFCAVGCLFALLQLAQTNSWRQAFYGGLAAGFLTSVLHLNFFWTIFSAGAVVLWLVHAFWLGLFVALARLSLRRFRQPWNWAMIPLLWTGIEYFRSELYYLRFSWLSPGLAFGVGPWQVPLKHLGVYGAGLMLAWIAVAACWVWRKSKLQAVAVLLAGTVALRLLGWMSQPAPLPCKTRIAVAGMQMEFPTEKQVLAGLDELVRQRPEAQLLVLSEYTFTDPLPDKVRDWCRRHQRYLVIGAEDPLPGGQYYNTAFVVSPAGEVVFRQVKSVPIQFFKDGLPAPEQRVWDSPWGKLGLCICYDLSYRRVTDRLIALGAEALIVPTMDVADWGQSQHELHARVAPVRAAEYGVPIFRLASSGISQAVDHAGNRLAEAPFAGAGAILGAELELRGAGRAPIDRWLAPGTSAATGIIIFLFLLEAASGKLRSSLA